VWLCEYGNGIGAAQIRGKRRRCKVHARQLLRVRLKPHSESRSLLSPRAISMRRFARVPTQPSAFFHEQCEYPRASLHCRYGCAAWKTSPEKYPITLVTRDISSTGVFLSPAEAHRNECRDRTRNHPGQPAAGRGNVVASPSQKYAASKQPTCRAGTGIRRSIRRSKIRSRRGVPTLFPSV